MPGPRSLPLLGTMWQYFPGGPLYGLGFTAILQKMRDTYGDIVRDQIFPGFTVVHVFNADDFETVFRTEGKNPSRDASAMMKRFYDKYHDGVGGFISAQGEDWYRLRTQFHQRMLRPSVAASYLDEQREAAVDLLRLLQHHRREDGIVENVLEYLYRYSMEAVGTVLYNKRLGALSVDLKPDSETRQFIDACQDVFHAMHNEFTNILNFVMETKAFKRMVKAHRFILQFSEKHAEKSVQRAHAALAKGEVVDGFHGDLLPYVLTHGEIEHRQAMLTIGEFIFAGVDSTAHGMVFTMYCLAKNPDKQALLIAEIDRVLPHKTPVTKDILPKMSYLRAAIKEALRLTPVFTGDARNAGADIVLSGYRIPAGTLIQMHSGETGREEKYFPEPESYLPERWMRGNPTEKSHPFAYLPFGFGPRSCLGKRFAEQEISLALISILQNYTIEYDDDLHVEFRLLNTPSKPMNFRFVERK